MNCGRDGREKAARKGFKGFRKTASWTKFIIEQNDFFLPPWKARLRKFNSSLALTGFI
jgi:hypothetical protein